jgi:hypothetical protein
MARHKRDVEFPSRFDFTTALHNHLNAHALGCFIAVINYSDGHNEIELTLFRSSQANLEAGWFVGNRGAGVYVCIIEPVLAQLRRVSQTALQTFLRQSRAQISRL